MSLTLAHRGRSALRSLRLSGYLHARVAPVFSHVGRVAQAIESPALQKVIASHVSRITVASNTVNSFSTSARRCEDQGEGSTTSGGGPKKAKSEVSATKEEKTGTKTTKSASKKGKSTRKTKKSATKKTRKAATTTKRKKAAKPKRELTPEQQERLDANKVRLEIRGLKKKVLQPPKSRPSTAYTVAIGEKLRELHQPGIPIIETFKRASERVKTLSPSELEKYAATAETNKAANEDAYASWIKSHTPLQIKEANLARRKLSKLQGKKKVNLLKDERLPKQPVGAISFYLQERSQAGDFKHMQGMDVMRTVLREWNGMTDAEKENYNKMAAADRERYIREYRTAYGQEPRFAKDAAKATAA